MRVSLHAEGSNVQHISSAASTASASSGCRSSEAPSPNGSGATEGLGRCKSTPFTEFIAKEFNAESGRTSASLIARSAESPRSPPHNAAFTALGFPSISHSSSSSSRAVEGPPETPLWIESGTSKLAGALRSFAAASTSDGTPLAPASAVSAAGGSSESLCGESVFVLNSSSEGADGGGLENELSQRVGPALRGGSPIHAGVSAVSSVCQAQHRSLSVSSGPVSDCNLSSPPPPPPPSPSASPSSAPNSVRRVADPRHEARSAFALNGGTLDFRSALTSHVAAEESSCVDRGMPGVSPEVYVQIHPPRSVSSSSSSSSSLEHERPRTSLLGSGSGSSASQVALSDARLQRHAPLFNDPRSLCRGNVISSVLPCAATRSLRFSGENCVFSPDANATASAPWRFHEVSSGPFSQQAMAVSPPPPPSSPSPCLVSPQQRLAASERLLHEVPSLQPPANCAFSSSQRCFPSLHSNVAVPPPPSPAEAANRTILTSSDKTDSSVPPPSLLALMPLGVRYDEHKNAFRAMLRTPGMKVNKSFSCKKYGPQKALHLAASAAAASAAAAAAVAKTELLGNGNSANASAKCSPHSSSSINCQMGLSVAGRISGSSGTLPGRAFSCSVAPSATSSVFLESQHHPHASPAITNSAFLRHIAVAACPASGSRVEKHFGICEDERAAGSGETQQCLTNGGLCVSGSSSNIHHGCLHCQVWKRRGEAEAAVRRSRLCCSSGSSGIQEAGNVAVNNGGTSGSLINCVAPSAVHAHLPDSPCTSEVCFAALRRNADRGNPVGTGEEVSVTQCGFSVHTPGNNSSLQDVVPSGVVARHSSCGNSASEFGCLRSFYLQNSQKTEESKVVAGKTSRSPSPQRQSFRRASSSERDLSGLENGMYRHSGGSFVAVNPPESKVKKVLALPLSATDEASALLKCAASTPGTSATKTKTKRRRRHSCPTWRTNNQVSSPCSSSASSASSSSSFSSAPSPALSLERFPMFDVHLNAWICSTCPTYLQENRAFVQRGDCENASKAPSEALPDGAVLLAAFPVRSFGSKEESLRAALRWMRRKQFLNASSVQTAELDASEKAIDGAFETALLEEQLTGPVGEKSGAENGIVETVEVNEEESFQREDVRSADVKTVDAESKHIHPDKRARPFPIEDGETLEGSFSFGSEDPCNAPPNAALSVNSICRKRKTLEEHRQPSATNDSRRVLRLESS